MKTITVQYLQPITKTFNIPKNGFWAEWFKAWNTPDDNRTDEQWDILDEKNMSDFIYLNEGIIPEEVEVWDYN